MLRYVSNMKRDRAGRIALSVQIHPTSKVLILARCAHWPMYNPIRRNRFGMLPHSPTKKLNFIGVADWSGELHEPDQRNVSSVSLVSIATR